MGTKTREVGGGPAVGLADEFVKLLQGGLTTGSFGGITSGQQANAANPVGSTMGIAGVLNDILMGGAGNLGGSLGEMINKDTERQAGNIRSRFTAGGGTSFGTPAAFSESLFRAEAAPRAATAVGNLQLQTLMPLLQMISGISGKGISQRETIAEPSTGAQIASIAAPLAAAGLSFAFPPAAPFALGAAGGASFLGGNTSVNQFMGRGGSNRMGVGGTQGFQNFLSPSSLQF
jgi:hypothetical protein